MDSHFEIVEPSASSLVESLRSFGYSIETALADLIDNSVTAGAKNVWLTFYWAGSDSWISLRDDGVGMSEAGLTAAMRLGSRSPRDERDPDDLGRFGLGLKTASFSQCRRLTVATRQSGGEVATRCWDLDYLASQQDAGVAGWRLLTKPADSSLPPLFELDNEHAGTVVLWEKLDRTTGDTSVDDKKAQASFHNSINRVEEHLAMVFHQYLEGPAPRLSIYINGDDEDHRVRGWDPFLRDHQATWRTPQEPIAHGGCNVKVVGFVLPHRDRLTAKLHEDAGGPRGWTAQQGFYVYRNGRLLVAGSWLGIGSPRRWNKEEQYKLARICVEIPNDTDDLWQIDVKKSTARPPLAVRHRLRDLAERVRGQARQVFVHRGAYSPRQPRQEQAHIWRQVKKDGRVRYRIDRTHVLVKSLAPEGAPVPAPVEALLKWLEETVPIHQIWLDIAEDEDSQARPFEAVDETVVIETMRRYYEALIAIEKIDGVEARQRIEAMPPFRDYAHLIDPLVDP